MIASSLTVARPPQLSIELSPNSSPMADLAVSQVVRSAALAAECPIAVFYLGKGRNFKVGAFFGVEAAAIAAEGNQMLAEAAQQRPDELLVINDALHQPDFAPANAYLFGNGMAPARFIAAVRVMDDQGLTRGILVVADTAPHAGLSAAKTYVLRTHAAQISALLELQTLRKTSGPGHASAVWHSNMERLRLLESVVVNANDAVLITQAEPIDLPGPRIVYCNAAFTKKTGYSEAEILGRTPRILQSSRINRQTLDKLRLALSRWEPVEVELLNCKKDGTEFWVELSIVPVANEKGWFTHWVSVQRDVSDRKLAEETATRVRIAEAENLVLEAEIQERKRVEALLLHTAFHDDLTKLRNRAFFMHRLTIAMDRAKSDADFRYAVMFMDLDRFKLVNDSLGHRAGDLLLMEVAQRLRTCIRPQDTLARVGGDEFALLIENIDDMTSVTTLAKRIIETMRLPLWLGKQEIFSFRSIGVVQATRNHQLPEELLRDADIAMYQAKRHETGSYAIFAGSMHENAVEALELQTDLQNAVARDEFFLLYQPICDSATTEIVGLEALIRWQHPLRGLVPPNAFIKTAEETGLIREIGRWVLRQACTQMRAWRDRFPTLKLRISVNTSGEELRDPRFTLELQDTLAVTDIDPRALQLEVTESIFLQHPERIGKVLSIIRALGVRIALDDFGTGYSSLSYVDQYEMDTIKIDQSFVAHMLIRKRTMAIVETIINLGRALDLDIVAEGVENDMQLQALLKRNCSSIQGYLLGHPMSVVDVDLALTKQVEQKAAS